MSAYFKVVSTIENLVNNDDIVTSLYNSDNKMDKINKKYNITGENTQDYRHEYLNTSVISVLVSSMLGLKVTSVERHFRTWRAGKRAKARLLNETLSTITNY